MVLYPTKLLEKLSISTTVVVGYQKKYIQQIITDEHHNSITCATQDKQLGTGHALACTKDLWKKDHILVMNGDMPLVTEDIIKRLYQEHQASGATISIVIAHNPDPSNCSYGRIIKDKGHIRIVEAKDFTGDAHEHCCINAGIYIFRKSFLEESINALENNNASKEFYLTDLIKIASDKNLPISTIAESFDQIRGINTFQELWAAEQVKRAELIKHWMERGVRFSVAQSVHIDLGVSIGANTYIGCGVHLLANTTVGKNCTINEFSSIQNTTLANNVTIYAHCIIKDTHIETHTKIGPYAHLRENTRIGSHTIVGNFVEVKKSTIGNHTKAKHMSYLGDATIGSYVNVGAGTITCNHNGIKKQQTIIEDHAYIGSNNSIVAPVTIHQRAYTGAGSVITKDVPANALAIARTRQINKEGYAEKLLNKKNNKKEEKSKKTEQSTSATNDDSAFSFIGARVINQGIKPPEET